MSSSILFSIIVVALNPGEKLEKTLESVFEQGFDDYEIILKDGLSKDGSVEEIRNRYVGEDRLNIFCERDASIYDAMNQAVLKASGRYVLFLNCGDIFYDKDVLGRIADVISKNEINGTKFVFYGNTYSEKTGAVLKWSPQITGFTCYRNIPCHQSCVYDSRLFEEKKYNLDYRIRADYDHFLWCYYVGNAQMESMDFVVASYEGGGYSESPENRARDKAEHKEITSHYMKKKDLLVYKTIMVLTLAPIRRMIGDESRLAKGYHWIKGIFYKK